MNSIEKTILHIQSLSNDQLRISLKEVYSDKISNNTDLIFKILDDEHWTIGLDRLSFIIKCIEYEILDRVKKDIF